MHFKSTISLAILVAVGSLPSFSQIAPNRYTLILDDPSVSERFTGSEAVRSGGASAYRSQLDAKHASLRGTLAARHIEITGSVSTLLNAVFVAATPDRVAELESLPGVRAVIPQRAYQRDLNRALGLIDVSAGWTLAGGFQNAGAGMKIGIIDTGIDQTHPAFQDASLSVPSGFPKCNVPSDCANFTNNKVIVARSYVPMLAKGTGAANSRPDDLSARDHDGHGTSVASAAAGNSASGTVTITGVAPRAWLGSYKVSGSPGVNDYFTDDVLMVALQDTFNDGMDVVNFSGGLPALYGPLDTGATCGLASGVFCDSVAHAFEQAAQTMVVVVSAGNAGYNAYYYPNFNAIGSPGTAPSVITVGATTNGHQLYQTISVPGGASNLQGIATKNGDAFTFYPGAVTLPLVDVTLLGDNGLACSSLPNYAPYGLYNAVALIQIGTCSASTKVNNAISAGATAVILYAAAGAPFNAPTGISNLIPTVAVSNSDGLNLKNYADANIYGPVTIDPGGSEQIDSANQNQLASYSSLGPNIGNNGIKPDLVAVGGDTDFTSFFSYVYTAAQNYDPAGGVFSSTRYATAAGTSVAAPLVAGAAALVKQKNPKFTPAQIKSALVNTATRDVLTDDSAPLGFNAIPADVQWYGGGKLDVGAAAGATITVSPVSLSFGALTSLPKTLPLQLTNNGSSSTRLEFTAAPFAGQPSSATLSFDQPNLTIAAGATATLNVTLSGTLPPSGEYSAFAKMTGSGVSLQVPVMYLVANALSCQFCNLSPLSFDFEGNVATVFPKQLAIKLTDDWGVAIAGAPVTFSASGGGSVKNADAKTDAFGIAKADAVLGSTPSTTTYTASAGPALSLTTTGYSRNKPNIPANGVTNAASLDPTQPIAPGSYIAIGNGTNPGSSLSDFTVFNTSARLPLALDPCLPGCAVSVSFDTPAGSFPGHLTFASDKQVNLQAPWELQGQTSAQVKVIFADTGGNYSFGNVVTVPVATYSPAFFEIAAGVAAAQDSKYVTITATHPAQRGAAVTFYLNGLGPVDNQPASGDPASLTTLAPTKATPVLMIGGQQATVSFSGLTPGLSGLYQINATIPASLTAGNQSVTVQIGGVTSKESGITVQ